MTPRTAPCPTCRAEARLLALLGSIEHYRCTACGNDFRRPAPLDPISEERVDTNLEPAAEPGPEPRREGRVGILERCRP